MLCVFDCFFYNFLWQVPTVPSMQTIFKKGITSVVFTQVKLYWDDSHGAKCHPERRGICRVNRLRVLENSEHPKRSQVEFYPSAEEEQAVPAKEICAFSL